MYCTSCGLAIRENANFCASCGRPQSLGVTRIVTPTAPRKPVSRMARIGDWMAAHPILTLVLLVLVLGQLSRAVLGMPKEQPATPEEQAATVAQEAANAAERVQRNEESLALIKCQEAEMAGLKAPSTAHFASYSESTVSPVSGNNGAFDVRSYVDAQNSFGAQIRTNFGCAAVCHGVDSCRAALYFAQ
jgi:zinc-ribbon domain